MHFSGLDLKNRDFGGVFCPILHIRTGAGTDTNRAEVNREIRKIREKNVEKSNFWEFPRMCSKSRDKTTTTLLRMGLRTSGGARHCQGRSPSTAANPWV